MSKKSSSTNDLAPVRQEVIDAREFKKLLTEAPELIARSRFVPPVIGRKDFGRFEIRYAIPRLRKLAHA